MYSVEKYKDIISTTDADTQKRYSIIEKLSKGLTVENDTALQMDKLLTEQLDLEYGDQTDPATISPASTSTTNAPAKPTNKKPKKRSASTSKKEESVDEVVDSFTKLFEAIKNQTGGSAPDEATMKEAMKELLKDTKISFSNLDNDLKKQVSSQPHVIQYQLPGKKEPGAFQKPDIPVFQSIVDDLVMGHVVMLIGGAGTGKTYMAENLLAKQALGRQHITINCSQWTSPTEIIGGQTMDGYQEGKLIEAWSKGHVLILDELPKIDPNTAGLLNDALAKTKIENAVIFNARKESFSKHPDFAVVMTGNVYPNTDSIAYGANNKQDLSLLDRVSGNVYFIEKNPDLEKRILQNEMIWSVCDKIRSVIEEMRYEAQISLRFMQTARDSYNLEMQRVKDKGKNGVKADEGKTFKGAVDSYISTFTNVQQKNIREKIKYDEIFEDHYYRNMDKDKEVY